MKITDIQGTNVSQLQTEPTSAVEPRAEQRTEANQNTDNIHLSQEARLMQKASRVIAETPDVREEKVAPLKEAVDQGSYPVDPQKVANSMIANLIMER
ncbi:MAG: flagellar biosynthesis anti-sigma factor FlgM [Deltaproteobacteria bacterium]|nr:flagellar biosynthesis anti-sigma factor FlgM [Deltaproteobacteria bacterium]MBI4794700.1 flagellar biosynthesis anti-sigma factor FlgM [Deltaproteobacteria bacterium]